MGEVDLHFKSSVPAFDACVALGRRHDRYVRSDTVEGLIDTMDRAGVEKALVYSPHAFAFDSKEGNGMLMEMIEGQPRLVPQFVVNPTFDNMNEFGAELHELGVRAVRFAPLQHRYPFREWVIGAWMEWLASERLPLWIETPQIEPVDLYETARQFPDTTIVLSEVHYTHMPWFFALAKSLPNIHVEMSRFLIADGAQKLKDSIGLDRVMWGSRFPDSSMAAVLYALHRSGLTDAELRAVCAGNLERLLKSN